MAVFLLATPAVAANRGGLVRVIVNFRAPHGTQLTATSAKRTIEAANGKVQHRFRLIDSAAATIPSSQLAALRAQPNVASVELDHRLTAFVDPELDASWGVKRIGAGEVHTAGNTGQGVKVGIIDTGIDYTHPDLDGVYAGGYDFFNNDADPFDDNGHGTHVAGILAAEQNNTGVVGVAPGASIYAYKVLNASGSGDYSGLIAALERATLVDHVNVVNMSLGGAEASSALAAAVTAAYASGTILVAASGNVDPTNFQQLFFGCPVVYPAAYPEVFATTFTGQNDQLTGYSCTGPQVDFASPGDQINSTVPTGSCMFCAPSGYRGDMSGTSMASPHLAGTVALVLAHGINNAGDTTTLADDVKAHLCSTASVGFGVNSTPIPTSDARYPKYFGCGVVDADNALITHPPSVDNPPPPPDNHPPVAADDSGTTQQDTAVTVGVLANDSDPDGDSLTVSSVSSPANGTAAVAAGGVRYTPAAGYSGPDAFSYTVSDGHGGSATANVNVTVTPAPPPPPNNPPVAVDDSATTQQGNGVTVNVLANDSDPDGDALSISAVSAPANGTAAVVGSAVRYTPAAGYNGSDSFGYTISDGHGGSATANVDVTVTPPPPPPPNRPPVAVNDSATTQHDAAVNVSVLANDSDPDGDSLAVSAVTSPLNGTAAIVGTTVRYTPAAGYFGPDTFGYTVSDGRGGTATANVNVTVTPPPSVNVADIDAFTSKNSANWSLRLRVYAESQAGTLLQNVVVNGSWGTGAGQGCTTNRFGYCEMSVTAIKLTVAARTYTIESLTSTGRVYLASANHDPDTDSDGTVIVVPRP